MEKNQDKGFTLVELLIVIVILGILATVTVFAVRGITDKGQDNACSIERKTLDTAVESFYAQNQADPVTMGTKAVPGDLVPAFLATDVDTVAWTFYAPGDAIPAGLGKDGAVGGGDDRAAVASAATAGFYYNDGAKCAGF